MLACEPRHAGLWSNDEQPPRRHDAACDEMLERDPQCRVGQHNGHAAEHEEQRKTAARRTACRFREEGERRQREEGIGPNVDDTCQRSSTRQEVVYPVVGTEQERQRVEEAGEDADIDEGLDLAGGAVGELVPDRTGDSGDRCDRSGLDQGDQRADETATEAKSNKFRALAGFEYAYKHHGPRAALRLCSASIAIDRLAA